MPYFLPGFSALADALRGLEAAYGYNIRRFVVKPNSLAASSSESDDEKAAFNTAKVKFNTLVERVDIVINCETDWKPQQEDLRELRTAMQIKVNETATTEDVYTARQTLLGGLIHRYFRFSEGKYTGNMGMQGWGEAVKNTVVSVATSTQYMLSFLGVASEPAPTEPAPVGANCRFLTALKTALNVKDNDLAADKVLDPTTVLTTLQCFRSYMTEECGGRKRYLGYRHVGKDANFEQHLNEMIQYHANRQDSPIVAKQYAAIAFINSLVKNLKADVSSCNDVLKNWYKELKGLDFSELSSDALKEHLNNYLTKRNCSVQKKVELNYMLQMVQGMFKNVKSLEKFEKKMQLVLLSRASSIMGGAYVLLTTEAEGVPTVDKKLKEVLDKAFDIEIATVLTPEKMTKWLTHFSRYYESELHEGRTFDLAFFNLMDPFELSGGMVMSVKQTLAELVKKQSEPALASGSGSSSRNDDSDNGSRMGMSQ